VTTQNPQIASTAELLRTITAEAIQREDGAPRAASVSIALESRDVVITNRWVEAALTYRTPLFGADADLSAPPANVAAGRNSISQIAGTVVEGKVQIRDAAGTVLLSEPFNLGLLDMNHADRRLTVLRKTGEAIAVRVAELR